MSKQDRYQLAHPYAKALFKLALDQNCLDKWTDTLTILAELVSQPKLVAALNNPNLNRQSSAQIIIEELHFFQIHEPLIKDTGANLVYLLAYAKRLSCLPEIRILYNQLRFAYENIIQIQAVTATPMSEEQITNLNKALVKYLQNQVTLELSIDPKLIGGGILRIGDQVIDFSICNQLFFLKKNLLKI